MADGHFVGWRNVQTPLHRVGESSIKHQGIKVGTQALEASLHTKRKLSPILTHPSLRLTLKTYSTLALQKKQLVTS